MKVVSEEEKEKEVHHITILQFSATAKSSFVW